MKLRVIAEDCDEDEKQKKKTIMIKSQETDLEDADCKEG